MLPNGEFLFFFPFEFPLRKQDLEDIEKGNSQTIPIACEKFGEASTPFYIAVGFSIFPLVGFPLGDLRRGKEKRQDGFCL